MKHGTHLSVNTVVTIVTLLLLSVLIIRQDNLISVIKTNMQNQLVEQRARQSLATELYNLRQSLVPTPTMGEIILNISEVK